MSSTTRLLVLGVVKLFQPVHGYEVRRELISWRAQEWAQVLPGSIYNALKTLSRDGFLEIVGTDQIGGRPERTSYRLTAAGEEELRALLREEWWTVRLPTDPLMAAISFLPMMSRAEAIAALEHRAVQVQGVMRGYQFAIDAHDGSESPLHVREMMKLLVARVGAELAWSEQLLARLRAGEYATADDPPWEPTPRDAEKKPAAGAARPTSPGGRSVRSPSSSERRLAARPARGATAPTGAPEVTHAHPPSPTKRRSPAPPTSVGAAAKRRRRPRRST